jgi:prepilin-type N-terminal cleavage/methylation domain-containing protein
MSSSLRTPQKQQAGFTLVELSVVLIILSLLVGGILGGQNLIAAAKLRSVGEEFKQYQAAAETFKEIYNAVPGDMINATDYWTDATNGNGDSRIDFGSVANGTGEVWSFWQQLAFAGLIEGQYTGRAGPGSRMHTIVGENIPGSGYDGGGWTVSHSEEAGWAWTAMWYEVQLLNVFLIGASAAPDDHRDGLLTPKEAWNIDTKYDDGIPSSGLIIGAWWDDDCGTAVTGTTAFDNLDSRYYVENDSPECALGFRKAF